MYDLLGVLYEDGKPEADVTERLRAVFTGALPLEGSELFVPAKSSVWASSLVNGSCCCCCCCVETDEVLRFLKMCDMAALPEL